MKIASKGVTLILALAAIAYAYGAGWGNDGMMGGGRMGDGMMDGGMMGRGQRQPTDQLRNENAGERIFRTNCMSCHPQGGNVIMSNLPLKGAPQLADVNTFIAYLRNPRLPNGSRGAMPPFPSSRVSQEEAKELYDYILSAQGNTKSK